MKIGSLASHLDMRTNAAIESVLGKTDKLDDLTEHQAQKVIIYLTNKLDIKKKDQNYKIPDNDNPNKRIVRRSFGLEGKKKPINLDE